MAVANTLAYYDTATITAVIGFIAQAPGACVIKLANIKLFWKGLAFKNKTSKIEKNSWSLKST
jgi:hypothetical protein